ncbi:MAG: HAMP domain-containing sensor histidine kinase [Rhodothermales bacterium]|nr:HAMP domain-containing sensor histidine kinase [Rhodothermales bacterium]
MRAYRLSVNLKLGLIVFAGLIAVASLWYTNHLTERLRAREDASIRIWSGAYKHLVSADTFNPYEADLAALDRLVAALPVREDAGTAGLLDRAQRERFRAALGWALSMPSDDQINFITDEIIVPNDFGVPAIVTDSATGAPVIWRNVFERKDTLTPEDSLRLRRRAASMDEVFQPIVIDLGEEGPLRRRQYVHYDESRLIKELRFYPYLQLLFVSLFILVGYLGFSYVRRSEQSSLWVGMAREAAHQLGTPISSLMGWTELLRSDALHGPERDAAFDDIEKDIERLSRVAQRFNDIGSMPRLDPLPLAPLITRTADYMRRRFPQGGRQVGLAVDVPGDLRAPLNAELFEWVIENLLKNALDAVERGEGHIAIRARRQNGTIEIDVRDNGKGIDRRQWKNVFRPGYSTKKRGWGLGLSLAKRIVEDYHGGTLAVARSRPGEGTTFRIELPALSNGQ